MDEIVHIIPIKHEIDRAVRPFEKMRANRIYLLHSKSRKFDIGPLYFVETVKKRLENKNIEIITVESENADPLPLLSTISEIIVREKKANNIIYVNMSAAGKLSAVASTLAAMYHDVKVYYVHEDGGYSKNQDELLEHGLTIINEPSYFVLTNFTIDIPSGARSTFLVELYKKERMTTNDIITLIHDRKLPAFEDLNETLGGKQRTMSNVLVRINRGLLDQLEMNGYITVEKRGRNKIIGITDKGRYAACLIGL